MLLMAWIATSLSCDWVDALLKRLVDVQTFAFTGLSERVVNTLGEAGCGRWVLISSIVPFLERLYCKGIVITSTWAYRRDRYCSHVGARSVDNREDRRLMLSWYILLIMTNKKEPVSSKIGAPHGFLAWWIFVLIWMLTRPLISIATDRIVRGGLDFLTAFIDRSESFLVALKRTGFSAIALQRTYLGGIKTSINLVAWRRRTLNLFTV